MTLDGEKVRLTRGEYRLLALLVEHVGVVVTRPILLMQIWGHAPETGIRTPAMHVRRLRKKLGMYSRYIETVVGVGYRFRPMPEPSRAEKLLHRVGTDCAGPAQGVMIVT